jgi:hypothetical protein
VIESMQLARLYGEPLRFLPDCDEDIIARLQMENHWIRVNNAS